MGEERIDIEELRQHLENQDLSAYFGGGFGGALVETYDIKRMSVEELIQTAESRGLNISD
jgi:hypothetical protein